HQASGLAEWTETLQSWQRKASSESQNHRRGGGGSRRRRAPSWRPRRWPEPKKRTPATWRAQKKPKWFMFVGSRKATMRSVGPIDSLLVTCQSNRGGIKRLPGAHHRLYLERDWPEAEKPIHPFPWNAIDPVVCQRGVTPWPSKGGRTGTRRPSPSLFCCRRRQQTSSSTPPGGEVVVSASRAASRGEGDRELRLFSRRAHSRNLIRRRNVSLSLRLWLNTVVTQFPIRKLCDRLPADKECDICSTKMEAWLSLQQQG
ncbi:hypothetical protein MUK42_11268, partial [Musa troglodytarum]